MDFITAIKTGAGLWLGVSAMPILLIVLLLLCIGVFYCYCVIMDWKDGMIRKYKNRGRK